uniref:Uncharacterized protein n=1 Tax=Chromera velia CCMP2878 TaxID=1169474 RepID=A0A0G4FC80_9ALVE|eukprot:Cvel_3191.t1-p1 / transcript=Cvel_3191.t1 / gene=Cvel_3191 / organism=Chromera_velia_CCMP2878 / gene_product=hypothetical protein / transcript_product=hypothetical protein / location=Cvel_scaffold124:87319-89074(+) / protein_length=96 / sequence_SO=supercontig / SO=protein_coding / is_pseudo=false
MSLGAGGVRGGAEGGQGYDGILDANLGGGLDGRQEGGGSEEEGVRRGGVWRGEGEGEGLPMYQDAAVVEEVSAGSSAVNIEERLASFDLEVVEPLE